MKWWNRWIVARIQCPWCSRWVACHWHTQISGILGQCPWCSWWLQFFSVALVRTLLRSQFSRVLVQLPHHLVTYALHKYIFSFFWPNFQCTGTFMQMIKQPTIFSGFLQYNLHMSCWSFSSFSVEVEKGLLSRSSECVVMSCRECVCACGVTTSLLVASTQFFPLAGEMPVWAH